MAVKFKNPFKPKGAPSQPKSADTNTSTPKPSGIKEATFKEDENTTNNPYLQSVNLYQSLYGGVLKSLHHARRLNKWLMGIIVFLLISVVYLGGQSKIEPYVTVVQNDHILYGELMKPASFERYRAQFIAFFLQKYIEASRTVSSDGAINSADRRQAFALVRDNATTQLEDFYRESDPNQIGSENTIEVDVSYMSPLANTDNVLQAGWTETIRQAKTGKVISVRHFKGTFAYKFDKPSQNMDFLKLNPFGFYITSFSWTAISSLNGVN